jgi:type IV pilus assembly protein PilC
MPYFRWKGIDLDGTMRVGRTCAASVEDLDTLLLHKNIALMSSRQLSNGMLERPVSMEVKIQFFKSLATLLEAGVMMPEALALVAHHVKHIGFHELLYTLKREVETGIPLSDAMAHHRHFFNPLMIEMVGIGYETGSLVISLQRLVSYLETMLEFKKRIRMALMMPLITFIFFIMIASVLVVYVVPQFESFFAVLKQPLPTSTRIVLQMSNAIRAYGLYVVIVMGVMSALLVWLYRKNKELRYAFDRATLSIPFFGPLLLTRLCAQISQALALLLEGGITVVHAFSIITSLVDNEVLKEVLIYVKRDIESGIMVSDALERRGKDYLGSDAIALVRVGETSATLAPMFAAAARRYQSSVADTLQRLLNIMQPLVIILLGLLITGLIMTIYVPIMSISWGV